MSLSQPVWALIDGRIIILGKIAYVGDKFITYDLRPP